MPRPRSALVKPVRKRLADGTVTTYYYDRRTGRALGQDLERALAWAAEHQEPKAGPASGSLAEIITAYLASARYRQKLKPRTQALYRFYLDQIRDRYGHFQVRAITPEMIQTVQDSLQDTPAKAHTTIAMFSIVLEFARLRGRISSNPAAHPGRITPRRRTEIWTHEAEERALAAFRPSLRLALMLLLYTVQRPSDVLAMTKGQITEQDGRLMIRLRQQKTDELLDVPVHARLRPMLLERLADPSGGLLLVPSPMGRSWSMRNFARAWDHDLRRANLRLARELFRVGWAKDKVRAEIEVQHRQRRDLRRTGIVRLAEAGATTPQIAAISGHSIDYCQKIIDTYLPRRTEVALGGMELWERAAEAPRVIASPVMLRCKVIAEPEFLKWVER